MPIAEAVRDCFAQACRDHAIAGIAFVRGGSDPLTLQIWNDQALLRAFLAQPLPFYTALGHSQELLLADKYSDESFTTPSDLGAQAGQDRAPSSPRALASSGASKSRASSPSGSRAPSRARPWRAPRQQAGGAGRPSWPSPAPRRGVALALLVGL